MNDNSSEEAATPVEKKTKTRTRKRTSKSTVDVAMKAYEDVARNMKKNNMPTDLIHQYVPQLSIEEIEKL